jgi:hypothetical protein
MRTGGPGSCTKFPAANPKSPLGRFGECPLLMEERTLRIRGLGSAFDPFATSTTLIARRPQGYLRNSSRGGGLIVYVLFRTKGDSKWAKRFSLHSPP